MRTFAFLHIKLTQTLSFYPVEMRKFNLASTGFHDDAHWPGPYNPFRVKILLEALPKNVMPGATKSTPLPLLILLADELVETQRVLSLLSS